VIDAYSNELIIERDGETPTAIVAPFSRRTTLIPDDNGYITDVVYADDSLYSFDYYDGGLLKSFTNPNFQTSTMHYYSNGKLLDDENAHGSKWTLTRTNLINGLEVVIESALERKRKYRVETIDAQTSVRTVTHPNTTITTLTTIGISETVLEKPDGTIITTQFSPDPRFGTMV